MGGEVETGRQVSANIETLVFGCIEAAFCKLILVSTRLEALEKIYMIYKLLYRSDLKISAKLGPHFCSSFTINYLRI